MNYRVGIYYGDGVMRSIYIITYPSKTGTTKVDKVDVFAYKVVANYCEVGKQ